MLVFISAVAVVLVVSFLCSIFESVLLSISRPQVEMLSRGGSHAGSLLARFKDNMDVPIAAILILNTAAHTVGAAVAGASYSNVFSPETLWIFSIVFTIAVLLFTEIIPKTLGVGYAQLLAVPVAHGIHVLTVLLKPLVVVSERISRSLRRDDDVPVTSAEEIRLLAMLGRSEGAVGHRTAGMILGATQLRRLQAHDVMLPREGVSFVSASMTREEVLEYTQRTGHSRFPFSPTGDLDNVSGIVLVKNLYQWLLTNDAATIDWEAILLEPLVVPESVSLPQLMNTFQATHRHLAIVVDEYGSVEGIVTLEDVLEEIVGDIRDESDMPADDFYERPDGTLIVRANVDLRRLCAKLEIPWQPDLDMATIGGYVTESLERIPVAGDTLQWNDHEIEVLSADRRRVKRLAIRKSG